MKKVTAILMLLLVSACVTSTREPVSGGCSVDKAEYCEKYGRELICVCVSKDHVQEFLDDFYKDDF
jgi:hypothetical protein